MLRACWLPLHVATSVTYYWLELLFLLIVDCFAIMPTAVAAPQYPANVAVVAFVVVVMFAIVIAMYYCHTDGNLALVAAYSFYTQPFQSPSETFHSLSPLLFGFSHLGYLL